MSFDDFLQVLTGFFGAIGFAILFNIRGKKLAAVAFAGFYSWLLFLVLGFFIVSEPTRYIIVASVVTLYSEIMARVLKTPASAFTITSLIPLIPGSSLYYTMEFGLEKNWDKFIDTGIATLQYASSLALGIIIGTALTKAGHEIKILIKNRNKKNFSN